MKPLTPADLFALTSTLVGPLWLLLIVSLFAVRPEPFVQWLARIGLPLLFGSLYAAALLPRVPFETGGFGSLAEVRALFENDWLLLAGCVHYLVFDFFVGAWIARDRVRVPRPLVVTCLIACFLAGGRSACMYLLLRGTLLALERARAT
ncbi:MAG TPA: abscisic acid-deficient protein Aba4 family protein [Gammaproteobacteria bacterium]|nr:abscisic acid-deficient protein Aba4 family protein [Gammaproteobacteria bacterium]